MACTRSQQARAQAACGVPRRPRRRRPSLRPRVAPRLGPETARPQPVRCPLPHRDTQCPAPRAAHSGRQRIRTRATPVTPIGGGAKRTPRIAPPHSRCEPPVL
eukprot:3282053-Pleurochrysis_carterae.AAC.1